MGNNSTDAEIVGYNIRRLLAAKGATQLEFAKAIGENQTTVSMWMTGKTVPRFSKFGKIADYFGCNLTDITDLKPEREVVDTKQLEHIMMYARALYELPTEKQKIVTDMIDALKGTEAKNGNFQEKESDQKTGNSENLDFDKLKEFPWMPHL